MDITVGDLYDIWGDRYRGDHSYMNNFVEVVYPGTNRTPRTFCPMRPRDDKELVAWRALRKRKVLRFVEKTYHSGLEYHCYLQVVLKK